VRSRREVITLLGGSATAWPLAARAQQPPMPLVGVVTSLSSSFVEWYVPGLREGLNETGYVDGRSVAIEYRAAEGYYDRLPGLVAELIEHKAAVIVAVGGSDPARVAKAATDTIPIVFGSAADPIKAGLVASLNRPGGNVTGVSMIGSALEAKRLDLLQQLVPGAAPIGVLVDPKYPDADLQLRELQEAAAAIKRQITIVRASTESEIDASFAVLARQGAAALIVATAPFFTTRREQIITLAARQKLPAIYGVTEFPASGGLMSYSGDLMFAWRQMGIYAGRILRGAKPADLPIMQPTKLLFVINLKTAKALGITFSPGLLAIADEVIE
jgi:putative tryptophan/tyrosine transport system substrate-binding protein